MKRVVIFFPSEWVSYSPTVLNLVETLKPLVSVKVIAIDNGKYDNTNLDPKIFHLVKVPNLLFKGVALIGAYRSLKYYLLKHAITPQKKDIVIGVDNLGMLCAQSIYNKVHFLSLEIERNKYFYNINWTKVLSLTIQSRFRLNYLLPQKHINTPAHIFFLPNSPILYSPPPTKVVRNDRRLIIFGNLSPAHGIFQCVDAIEKMEAITLTLKGPIQPSVLQNLTSRYSKLFNEKRLMIDNTYVSQKNVIDYLKKFTIGFCFYDFNIIEKGDFNYLSSPSGKIYNYFAASVPVIGSDIIGLEDVTRFDAGILLSQLSPQIIKKTISEILEQQQRFQLGCQSAAISMDFGQQVLPYKDYLLQHNETNN